MPKDVVQQKSTQLSPEKGILVTATAGVGLRSTLHPGHRPLGR